MIRANRGFLAPAMVIALVLAGGAASALCQMSAPAGAGDWPCWGGKPGRNMVTQGRNLPLGFDAGESREGRIPRSRSANVKWQAALGKISYGTPVVAGGRVYVGTNNERPRDPKFKGDAGVLMCFRESDGELLWQLVTPKCKEQGKYNGDYAKLGIMSAPVVDGDRLYLVTNRCAVVCLDAAGMANGNDGRTDEGQLLAKPKVEKIWEDPDKGMMIERQPGEPFVPGPKDADVIWRYDMMVELPVWVQDASNCNILMHGDYLYVSPSNGVDRTHTHVPVPDAPSLIVLDKHTGRLVAVDDAGINRRIFHGQWSSPSMGVVNGRTLVFFGGGDGFCYAFDAQPAGIGEGKVAALKMVWKFDCNPAELRLKDGKPIPYQLKHIPRGGDGPSEIIATPAFCDGKVYVDVGQDLLHGMGPGCLSAMDAAAGQGDITEKGLLWRNLEVDRSISTVAVADGLVYAADYTGRLFCIDANTGKTIWKHDTRSRLWSSPLVGDGKVYIGTESGEVQILAAGRVEKLLGIGRLDSAVYTTPVVVRGMFYVASQMQLLAINCDGTDGGAEKAKAEPGTGNPEPGKAVAPTGQAGSQ